MRERLVPLAAVTAALAFGSTPASANTTGGAPADFTSAPPVAAPAPTKHAACPRPERLKRTSKLSEACRGFLMQTLQNSVYDDPNPILAVVTYQKLAGVKNVDGSLGPITAKSILKGRGLTVSSPDPAATEKELYVRKRDQVALMITGGVIEHAFSVSTGSGKRYREETKVDGVHKGIAITPVGTFRIKEANGPNYVAPLGKMPYARFIDNDHNIAVHSGYVDADGNDSHGCIRMDNQTMVRYIVPNFNVGNVVKVVA